jgi:prepilin peptidase CpaA
MLALSWPAASAALVVCTACWTDLRWRRIPNLLTFPALGLGLVYHAATGGWEGFFGALLGAAIAPALLALLHAGRGVGMGDLKLVAALGAVLGLSTGVLVVLVTAIAGGLLAGLRILMALKGVPVLLRRRGTMPAATEAPGAPPAAPLGALTIPYALAIAMGTFITLAAQWF